MAPAHEKSRREEEAKEALWSKAQMVLCVAQRGKATDVLGMKKDCVDSSSKRYTLFVSATQAL